MRVFVVLIAFFSIFLLGGCSSEPLHHDTQLLMGSYVQVVSSDSRAAAVVFDEIRRIEKMFSIYDSQSEISRLNAAGRLKVSPEVVYVVGRALDFYRKSNGAFDVTIGPLMDVWGFRDGTYRIPSQEELAKVMPAVGSDKIRLNGNENVIEFMHSGMRMDLGALVPGYAVDCAVARLKEKGIRSCLVNAGGEVYCLGYKYPHRAGKGALWQVAIQHPREKRVSKTLALHDCGVATSGDYEQYFQQGRRRLSHIFDPARGMPSESGVASVTVVADDCLTADALSTIIFVMGRQKGAAFALNNGARDVYAVETNEVR